MYSINSPDSFTVKIMDRSAENGSHETFEDFMRPESPFSKHRQMFKSGLLARCHNRHTACASNFTSNGPSVSQKLSAKNAFIGGAKNVHTRVIGWSRYWFPPVLNPHAKFVQRWNKFFVISCLFAIFVDPLFFFLFSVRQNYFCITFDVELATIVTVLRSLTDFIYFLHMLLQFRLAYVVTTSCTVGAGELVHDPKTIALHYLQGWFILDLFAVLPVPQIIIWIVVRRLAASEAEVNFAKNMLRVTVLLQYIPRCIRILPLAVGSFVFETAKANFVINLFVYLLAAHVVGSSWYLFALQRVNVCLHEVCKHENPLCRLSFLDCGNGKDITAKLDPPRSQWIDGTNASQCLVNPSFSYGIYATAVPVTLETEIINKYVYSLFWGFLQISTLAGNQVPSLFVWEVLFTMGVIGLGLLLFALLIGNMQNFLQSLGRRQMDMQLRRHDVETWMKRRNLPFNLRKRVREAERFKWATTRGVDEEKLVNELQEDLQKEIQHVLYLTHLKKVHLFTVMEDIVLDAICERVHQRFYIKDSIILRMNHPIGGMMFIVRGQLESIGDDGFKAILNPGEFCGEELLTWCIEHAAAQSNLKKNHPKKTGQRALSSRIVKCITNVEAFILEASDLEYVTNHFSRYMRSPRVQGAIRYESPYWRSWAARRIQATWKYKKRKIEKSFKHGVNKKMMIQN